MNARDAFEFADRVYVCDKCGSQQPDDKECPECGWNLLTWAGFLGRRERFRIGIGDDLAGSPDKGDDHAG